MGCLSMCIIHTHTHTLYVTAIITNSQRIRNYTDSDRNTGTRGKFRHSHAAPRHIRMPLVVTQPHKQHSQSVRHLTAVIYQITCGVIHKNLAGDAHHMLFFNVQPANQPAITVLDFSREKFGRRWFTATCVIRYKLFVSVHTAPLHPECYTTDKNVKITSLSLRIYNTLKIMRVTESADLTIVHKQNDMKKS
jgi:hypothetical protein